MLTLYFIGDNMTPAAERRVIKTETANIWLDEKGIAWIENHVPAVTKADIQANHQAVWEISGHTKRPVINLIEGITMVDKEARDYGAGEESQKIISAMALVAKHTLTVFLANLFISVSRPPFPTKMFSSQAAALDWLDQFTE